MSRVRIRPLETLAERRACVALQEETWGAGFADRVPASILMVASETGGIASGAFVDGRLVGFVFGITGLRNGRPTHWSDMLAVHPAHRGRGLGLALKRHQWASLLERGVEEARWTFDPLVARNAHINLNRLGATVGEYRRDLYGDSDSPLHAGIGTDRLVAEWALASDRVRRHLDDAPATSATPERVINAPAPSTEPPRPGDEVLEPGPATVGIVVPAELDALRGRDPGLARAWRENVRAAFERCFAAGYTGIALRAGGATATYVLSRDFAR